MTMRPIPGDPGAESIEAMLAISDDWLLTAGGGYETGAVETMTKDGGNFLRAIALTWPARRNHTTDQVTVRLLISPEDAIGLAANLVHTADWMLRNVPE